MARRLVLEAEPIAGCEVLLDVRLWVADRVGVQRPVEGITELAVVAAQDRVEVGNDAVRCKGDLLLLSQGRIVFVFKDGAGVLKLMVVGAQDVHPVPTDAVKFLDAVKRFLSRRHLINRVVFEHDSQGDCRHPYGVSSDWSTFDGYQLQTIFD